MKKGFILPIILALLIGYLCANYVLALYEEENTYPKTNIYFLQAGAYDNISSTKDELININNKLTVKEKGKYYTYIGITKDASIALKIKELYKNNNINLFIKNVRINNNDFLTELEQYDILLKNSKTFDEINSVLKTILATYEERVLNR